jgi:tellurite resistance protein TerC
VKTVGSPLWWISFVAFVVFMLALDLGVFNRRAHEVRMKEAAIWSGVWVGLAIAFNIIVAVKWGGETAQAFLTGYLIEKSLSIDNLFVFYMVFQAFHVEPKNQHRVLFWGIVGALVMRAGMVFGGTTLLANVHWIVYVFGGLLIATGVRMLLRSHKPPRFEGSRTHRVVKRVFPSTSKLLMSLVVIEVMDIVFAIDSITAIFAITTDPFIVFTSNIFAVLGMRSLYFVLAGVAGRFVYLQPGLALVLIFVGAKLAVSRFLHIPALVSMIVVLLLLAGSILASIYKRRKSKGS